MQLISLTINIFWWLFKIMPTGPYCGPLRWQSLFEFLAKNFVRFFLPLKMPQSSS
jgi:hypothetical protein